MFCSHIGLQVVLLRRYEDRTMEALSCSGQAVQKVRLDFGWEGALAGEGIEGVEMEWNALCYDITVRVALNHQHLCFCYQVHCCCVTCFVNSDGTVNDHCPF